MHLQISLSGALALRATAALLLIGLLTACEFGSDPGEDDGLDTTVIMISIDGFGSEYLDRIKPPNISRLAAEGVHAPGGMIPVFPSLTFPNHYSLATGLYPENNGIVSNTMFDPQTGKSFRIGNREAVEDPAWWGGEPIWVTAELQGQTAGAFFWVGTEAPIKGIQPTYWKRFDASVPGKDRIDEVLRWLDLPDGERPTLINLYFGEVDNVGHEAGPFAQETSDAVLQIDAYIGRLLDGLRARSIEDEVNLIIVSDHGMSQLSAERVIALDDYISLDDVNIIHTGPVTMLTPLEGKKEAVLAALRGAHPNFRVFAREEMPERYHFRAHYRIPEVIVILDDGWTMFRERERMERYRSRVTGATHGFDNFELSMRALFVAHGPAFKSGYEIEPFENIHIYELVAGILGLEPAPNDGDAAVLRPILKR